MKRNISLWQICGFVFTGIFGVILHFLYDWTDESILIAPFSGVNESTWEHMKLLFWPLFLFALVQRQFFKDQENYWCVKLAEILLGLVLIPVLFYTYNGVIGKSPDWVNISIFFICAATAYVYESKQLKSENARCASPKTYFLMLCFIAMLFVVFTFKTPHLAIFEDPLSKTYGI